MLKFLLFQLYKSFLENAFYSYNLFLNFTLLLVICWETNVLNLVLSLTTSMPI